MTEVTPMDRAQTEARNGIFQGGKATLTGRKGSAEIDVPHFMDWGTGAISAISRWDIGSWVSEALDAENQKAWAKCSPTNTQASQFFLDFTKETGEDLGESPAS